MEAYTLYQGRAETDRLTYRFTLCDFDCYDMSKVPNGAVEFAAWFNSMLQEIPQEHRASAVIKTWTEDCDECSSARAKFNLYYDRLETDEEYATRMEKAKAKREKDAASRATAAAKRAVEKEQHEHEEYERLKKKFGSL